MKDALTMTREEKRAQVKRLLRRWQLMITLERRYGRKVEHLTRNKSNDWNWFGPRSISEVTA